MRTYIETRVVAPFFRIEPEMAGAPLPGEADVPVLFSFDTWLGDDLVRAYPALLATTALKQALSGLPDPRGFQVEPARVRASRFRRRHHPGERLPRFWTLSVHGKAGRDDMGLTTDGSLVVSRRVFDVLIGFRIDRVVFALHS
jgi:hypothetical protein